jgi:pyruvate/2-oxoglutarate dehydrogenase complex dihydrolipoamide acyltransferase (E2) component
MLERHVVVLPILGNGPKHAKVRQWHKKAGDWVVTGTILCTVEAKKALYDVEADADGFLTPLVEVGKSLKPGAPLAVLSPELEGIDAIEAWLLTAQSAVNY